MIKLDSWDKQILGILLENSREYVTKIGKRIKLRRENVNYRINRMIKEGLIKEFNTVISEKALGLTHYVVFLELINLHQNTERTILEYLKPTAIILYGSVIQTNYHKYNDIDVLIVTKKKSWKNKKEKYKLINELNKKSNLKLDIQIIDEKTLKKQYPHNPSLIYQLSDIKIIYGDIKLTNKIEIYNIDLRMKMDWTMEDERLNGIEIYKALRNVILVKLILNKIIDNKKLNELINYEIGEDLKEKLITNRESIQERKIAMRYLNRLVSGTYKLLEGDLWEKRVVLKV